MFVYTPRELEILNNRKRKSGDSCLSTAMTQLVERIANYDSNERAWLREEILRTSDRFGQVRASNYRLARKNNKAEEKVFDENLDKFLKLDLTSFAKIEMELGPSPFGYTYRFGFHWNEGDV